MCSSSSSSKKRQPDARPISRRTAQRIMEEAAAVEAAAGQGKREREGREREEGVGSREESSSGSSSRGLSNKQQSPVSETGTGEFIKVNSTPALLYTCVCVLRCSMRLCPLPLCPFSLFLSLSNCQNASKRTSLDL